MELYGRVRHAVMIEGLSQREAARCFGIDPRTVRKMLSYSVPPGYVRTRPPVRPKLDPFIGIIDRILEEDKDRPKKQRHTSKRIFERLRDEYGFTGKITIVKDYICGVRQRRREMFVPLTHPPGHAQVDFGEALAVIGGVVDPSRKSGGALHRLHCFCLEFDGACEVQRRVPTDWIIEPIDVSGYPAPHPRCPPPAIDTSVFR